MLILSLTVPPQEKKVIAGILEGDQKGYPIKTNTGELCTDKCVFCVRGRYLSLPLAENCASWFGFDVQESYKKIQ